MRRIYQIEAHGGGLLDEYGFDCPGCGSMHVVRVKGNHPVWDWNGSLESPTFTPSLMVQWDYGDEPKVHHVCHSFVTDGKIQFLPDSTHKLAGHTVDLPELPD